MDKEEEEIERNISDSKEGVDGISDSDKRFDAESKEKAYRGYVFRNDFETMNKYQDRHGQILSSKKLKEALLRVMDEEEE